MSGGEGDVSAQVLVIIEGASGVEWNILVDEDVLIYPNPTEGLVSIKAGFIIQRIEVLNIKGQIIQSSSIQSRNAEVQLADKPAGIYFLLITGAHQRIAKRLIVR